MNALREPMAPFFFVLIQKTFFQPGLCNRMSISYFGFKSLIENLFAKYMLIS